MISIEDNAGSLTNHLSRREWMRVGGLSAFGLTLPQVLRATESPTSQPPTAPPLAGELGSAFGKAKSVIVLWL